MTNLTGMDVVEVTRLAQRLANQAVEIQSTIGMIDGIASRISESWSGPDATEFVGWWYHQHRPALQRAQSDLSGLAQSALNNAQQQTDASDPGTFSIMAAGAAAANLGIATGLGVAAATAVGGASGNASVGSATAGNPAPVSGVQSANLGTPNVTTLTNGTFDIGGKQMTYTQWCDAHGYDGNVSNPGECAAYAAFRRAQLGLSLPTGNGNSEAASVGLVSSPSQINVGSLVSVPGTADNPYGHVMVVEQVLGNNPPQFRVSEMNAAGLSVNGAVINSDNFRTDSVLNLSQGPQGSWTGTLKRAIVDGQGGTSDLGTVSFSGGT